ncbi:hypothetical protein GF1_30870 [Desulfolithobacter dissulfuricans]|uniref:Uncharacterized protein n=1 Tax=Desulfolithobacter dissulfuricans TaxID=2795293 RepID=A0A915U3J6_9BACT|nr:CD1871A family CXXC motif-containing protein [Desulfolithobacter dissulfuricans]BCO10711.1 hypothetical protein GF1_30870 [Desulfolithobacter dissulfuricans]
MKKKSQVRKSPFILITLFLFMWLIGVSLGEPTRVLEQAWSICLACIGIG